MIVLTSFKIYFCGRPYIMKKNIKESSSEIKNRKKTVIYERLLLAFLILVPPLFIFQGIDFTDMGFWLSKYELFFTPFHDATSALCYLSELLGAFFQKIFPIKGILGTRIGFLIVVYTTMFFVWLTLKSYLKRIHILTGLALGVLCIFPEMKWINYNNLTALFYAISAYCLMLGLKTEKRGYYLLTGFFLTCNIFIRFPNILGLSLLCVPVYHSIVNSLPWKKIATIVVAYLAGGLLAFGGMLLVVDFLGHWEVLLGFFGNFSHFAPESHSFSMLLFQLRLTKKLKINFFCFKKLNIN